MDNDDSLLQRVLATPRSTLQALVAVRDKLIAYQPEYAVEDLVRPTVKNPDEVMMARSHSAESVSNVLDSLPGQSCEVLLPNNVSELEVLLAPETRGQEHLRGRGFPRGAFSMNRRMGRAVIYFVRVAAAKLAIHPSDPSAPDSLKHFIRFVATNEVGRIELRECISVLFEIAQSILVHCNASPALLALVLQSLNLLTLIEIAVQYTRQCNHARNGRNFASELRRIRTMFAGKPFTSPLASKLIDAYCLEFMVDAVMPPSVCSARFEAIHSAAWQIKSNFISSVASSRVFSLYFIKNESPRCLHNLLVFALHGCARTRIKFFNRLINDGLIDQLLSWIDHPVRGIGASCRSPSGSSVTSLDVALAMDRHRQGDLLNASLSLDILSLLSTMANDAALDGSDRRATRRKPADSTQCPLQSSGSLLIPWGCTAAYCVTWASPEHDMGSLLKRLVDLAVNLSAGSDHASALTNTVLVDKAIQVVAQCCCFTNELLDEILDYIETLRLPRVAIDKVGVPLILHVAMALFWCSSEPPKLLQAQRRCCDVIQRIVVVRIQALAARALNPAAAALTVSETRAVERQLSFVMSLFAKMLSRKSATEVYMSIRAWAESLRDAAIAILTRRRRGLVRSSMLNFLSVLRADVVTSPSNHLYTSRELPSDPLDGCHAVSSSERSPNSPVCSSHGSATPPHDPGRAVVLKSPEGVIATSSRRNIAAAGLSRSLVRSMLMQPSLRPLPCEEMVSLSEEQRRRPQPPPPSSPRNRPLPDTASPPTDDDAHSPDATLGALLEGHILQQPPTGNVAASLCRRMTGFVSSLYHRTAPSSVGEDTRDGETREGRETSADGDSPSSSFALRRWSRRGRTFPGPS